MPIHTNDWAAKVGDGPDPADEPVRDKDRGVRLPDRNDGHGGEDEEACGNGDLPWPRGYCREA